MKRTPLARRTPMPRSNFFGARTALAGRGGKPLRPVSTKRARENRERTQVLRPLREEQQWCTRCGATGCGFDAHEVLSAGRGGSRTDLTNIILLCRPCHDWVTTHPAEAEAAGWSKKTGVSA